MVGVWRQVTKGIMQLTKPDPDPRSINGPLTVERYVGPRQEQEFPEPSDENLDLQASALMRPKNRHCSVTRWRFFA